MPGTKESFIAVLDYADVFSHSDPKCSSAVLLSIVQEHPADFPSSFLVFPRLLFVPELLAVQLFFFPPCVRALRPQWSPISP